MRAEKSPDIYKRTDLGVAIIGDFQIGKSTFVNCLVGLNVADVGRGKSTTHKNKSYLIGNGVTVIDTPGFNAPGKMGARDEAEAREAIQHSFVVVVFQDKMMGELCRRLIREEVIKHGKKCVLVYNCTNYDRWAPSENDNICQAIEAEVFNCGYLDSCVRLGAFIVLPINAQWAMFGLGLLENENDIGKIRRYAYDDLGIHENIELQSEMLRRSNILEIKRYIENLPLSVLSDFLNHREQATTSLINRFCIEFNNRLAGPNKS